MFDIGFSELMIIAVVALIVIGPERLPGVARTLGHLLGRMQRYVADVKADISREMELEELKKLRTSMEDAARSFEQSVTREVQTTESELNRIAQEANPAALLQEGEKSAAQPTDAHAGAPAAPPESLPPPQAGAASPLNPAQAGAAPEPAYAASEPRKPT